MTVMKIRLNSIPVYRRVIDNDTIQYSIFEDDENGNLFRIPNKGNFAKELELVYAYIQDMVGRELQSINTEMVWKDKAI